MTSRILSSQMTSRIPRCLMPLLYFAGGLFGQGHDQASAALPSTVVHVRAILGLEHISSNATGELSIQDDALIFRRSEGPIARIPIGSIQDVFLSQEDKQVGGTPMALGKAATPFGGGRVIGLLAHKKYDLITFEYRDVNGGLHGVIFQLNKGQGQAFAEKLEMKGVHVSDPEGDAKKQRPEVRNEVK